MSDEIEKNTKQYLLKNKETFGYCYINTISNCFFWRDSLITTTINCDHLVRFKKMDFGPLINN